MKKIFYIVEVLIFIIILNPFSCSVNLTDTWTVSGSRTFNGTPPAGTPIKLAAFFDYVIVSNVADITDIAFFHLHIDASNLDPYDNARIELIMWEDDNNNDSKDSGEWSSFTEPAPGGCPVFGDEGLCHFEWYEESGGCFSDRDKGWNVSKEIVVNGTSCTSESVDTAVLTGARITNSSSF